MMLRKMTPDEAFVAACAANGADTTSHWADRLQFGDLVDALPDVVRLAVNDAGIVAICTYFAVRGGATVMREETPQEREDRLYENDAAWR